MSLIRFRTPTHVPAALEGMNRMFDDFFARPLAELSPFEWRGPAVDVYETDDEVVVKAELPGVRKEDVQVHIEGDALTIRGETRHSEEVKEDGYYRREMRYGNFHRTIPIPVPIKQEEIKAKFEDGILTVRAPKSVEATIGKQIAIE